MPTDVNKGGNATRDIVAKLRGLCHVLPDDGITSNEYVTELPYLLFLKMMQETGHDSRIPNGYCSGALAAREGLEQLEYHRRLLLDPGDTKETFDPTILAIFADAATSLRKPANLKTLTTAIDKLDWYSARAEGLGDFYEGLLEKNAAEKKSGAGQYFTPPPADRLHRPAHAAQARRGDAGPGRRHRRLPRRRQPGHHGLNRRLLRPEPRPDRLPTQERLHRRRAGARRPPALPDEPDAARHREHRPLPGHPVRGRSHAAPGRPDPRQPAPRHQEGRRPAQPRRLLHHRLHLQQAARLRRALRPRAQARRARRRRRADNVLFEDNTGRRLPTRLMELCDLHTILRLPTGIFYAQGVKTNVLFFTRGQTDCANTQAVRVYDLRANMPAFGKTRPLTAADFADFEAAFGTDPYGKAERTDQGRDENKPGRFRFTRAQIAERNDNLDIAWLRDEEGDAEERLDDPEDIAAAIIGHLRAALEEIEGLAEELERVVDTEAPT